MSKSHLRMTVKNIDFEAKYLLNIPFAQETN